MKTFTDGKYLDEILNCMDRLQKAELAIEVLPNKFTKKYSEGKDTINQRKQIEYEIFEVQDLLRKKLSGI